MQEIIDMKLIDKETQNVKYVNTIISKKRFQLHSTMEMIYCHHIVWYVWSVYILICNKYNKTLGELICVATYSHTIRW